VGITIRGDSNMSVKKRRKSAKKVIAPHPRLQVRIIGNPKSDWGTVPVRNEYPSRELIPADTPSITGQRAVYMKTVDGWIQEEGGFIDRRLMLPLVAARWEDENSTTEEPVIRVFDGGHRSVLRLLGSTTISEAEVWADVIDVNSEAEANLLFLKLNHSRRKSMETEDKFVNGFLGESNSEKDYEDILIDNEIKVTGTSGVSVPTVYQLKPYPSLSVKALKQSKKVDTEEAFSAAVEILRNAFTVEKTDAFGNSLVEPEDFNTRLFQGMSCLCNEYDLFSEEIDEVFTPTGELDYKRSSWSAILLYWLTKQSESNSQDDFAKSMWGLSPQIKGYVDVSMAYAILKQFRSSKQYKVECKAKRGKGTFSLAKLDKLVPVLNSKAA